MILHDGELMPTTKRLVGALVLSLPNVLVEPNIKLAGESSYTAESIG